MVKTPGAPRKKDQDMLKKVVFALVAGSIVMGASACNTVKGAGKDVQSAGQAGENVIKGN